MGGSLTSQERLRIWHENFIEIEIGLISDQSVVKIGLFQSDFNIVEKGQIMRTPVERPIQNTDSLPLIYFWDWHTSS